MIDPKIIEAKVQAVDDIEHGKIPMIIPPPKQTEHRELIIALCKLFQSEVYVELGVKDGYVFNEVAKYVKKAVGVDQKGFTRHTEYLSNAVLYTTSTDNFIKIWKKNHIKYNRYGLYQEENIDMLFIDACHEKEQVLNDFFGLECFVKTNTGLILLHDTYPCSPNLASSKYCWNAYEAAYEIRKNFSEQFEIVTLPGPIAGISIIRKAVQQVPWLEVK